MKYRHLSFDMVLHLVTWLVVVVWTIDSRKILEDGHQFVFVSLISCDLFDSTSTVVFGTQQILTTTEQGPIITLTLSKVHYALTFASSTTALSVLVVSDRYS